jgi:GABA permease
MHNPLRSEAEVFRAVVAIGAGAALVAFLALVVSGTLGAVAFFVLIAAGVLYLWRRSRGSEPTQHQVSSAARAVYRVLVIANQTVGGRSLLDEIAMRCEGKRAEVLVISPALTSSQLQHWASDTDEATIAARARLEASVDAIKGLGLSARGQVGDQDPNVALADALSEFGADEVIISTHPPDRSRWLEHGVVAKARAEVPLPVTHVVVDLEAEAAPAR